MFPLRKDLRATSLIMLCGLAMASCGGSGGGGNSTISQNVVWLIPERDVVDGGPGVDGIPALTNPSYESAATISTVQPDDRVIVIRHAGQYFAYPHNIMDWHEIVNDNPSGQPFILSYCPLTGSAMAWEGNASHGDWTFGTSGLLYNSNLILYDRQTQSYWSQMLQQAVNGPRIQEIPATIQVVEMQFSTLQRMYPDAMVMTRDTGFDRDYDFFPYNNYQTSNGLLFPADNTDDNRLHKKERVLGVLAGAGNKVYQLAGFGSQTQAINEQLGTPIVVVGNTDLDFAVAYQRELADGTILTFSPVQDDLPNVMTDDEGNAWDVFGTATSGPRAGEQLAPTQSYVAMWFAWTAFFLNAQIHFN